MFSNYKSLKDVFLGKSVCQAGIKVFWLLSKISLESTKLSHLNCSDAMRILNVKDQLFLILFKVVSWLTINSMIFVCTFGNIFKCNTELESGKYRNCAKTFLFFKGFDSKIGITLDIENRLEILASKLVMQTATGCLLEIKKLVSLSSFTHINRLKTAEDLVRLQKNTTCFK